MLTAIATIAIDAPICVWGTAGIAVRGAGVLRAAAVFRAPATGSSAAAKGDDGARGAGQDQKVEAEALPANVIKIVGEFFARALDTSAVAEIDLCPAGQLWPHGEPEVVKVVLLAHQGRMPRLLRPRADKAHVTAKDIDRLRQLVEMKPPKRTPDPGDPRIVGGWCRFGARQPRLSRSWFAASGFRTAAHICPSASADRGWARGPRA
jgi:hypothetical protein